MATADITQNALTEQPVQPQVQDQQSGPRNSVFVSALDALAQSLSDQRMADAGYPTPATTKPALTAAPDAAVPTGPISQGNTVIPAVPDYNTMVPGDASQSAYNNTLNRLQTTLGDRVAASQQMLQAQVDATKQNAALQQTIVDSYNAQQNVEDDALGNIQMLNRIESLSGLPGEFGELGDFSKTITGVLGMFDSDFNRQYQLQRIAGAQQKTVDTINRVKYMEDVNNAQPALAELQQKIVDATYEGLAGSASLQQSWLANMRGTMEYKMNASQAQWQELQRQIDNTPMPELQKLANDKSNPNQALYQSELWHRKEVLLSLASMDASLQERNAAVQAAKTKNFLMMLNPEEIEAGILQAQQTGARVVTIDPDHNAKTKNNVTIPLSLMMEALPAARQREKDAASAITADFIDKANLGTRLASAATSVAALQSHNPKLAGYYKVLRAFAGSASQGPLTWAQAQQADAILNQIEPIIKTTAKTMGMVLPKPAQAAVAQLATTGNFTQGGANDFLAAVLPNPAMTQTSKFDGVMGQLRALTDKAVRDGKIGDTKIEAKARALYAVDPDKGRPLVFGQVLDWVRTHPDKAVGPDGQTIPSQLVRSLGSNVILAAVGRLANDTKSSPVWKSLIQPGNQGLWMEPNGTPNIQKLTDLLAREELQQTVKNGRGGRDMTGVYRDTFRQALQQTAVNAPSLVGADPQITLSDRALLTSYFGGRDISRDAASQALVDFGRASAASGQAMQQRIQQDINGQTLQTYNRAQYNDSGDVSPTGNPAIDGSFVTHKLQQGEPNAVQSATGVGRLTVQDIRNRFHQ